MRSRQGLFGSGGRSTINWQLVSNTSASLTFRITPIKNSPARPVGASPYRVSTPVADSDLILTTLANRGGWLCLLLALSGVFVLFASSLLLSGRGSGWLSCLGTGAGCSVALSGLLNLFSTSSLLLIGLQFPFLGKGGTGYCMSWVSITLLLISTTPTRQGSRELAPPKTTEASS